MSDVFSNGPKKTKAPRGFPKDGECSTSRTKLRPTRGEIEAGEVKCYQCGAVLKLRALSPGMSGEKRVSPIMPAHKAAS